MRRTSVNDVSRLRNSRKISNAQYSERSVLSQREDQLPALTSRNSVTVSFSYAGAVERALRHRYNVSSLSVPPTASARRRNAGFYLEVTRLPDIYNDFTQVSKLQVNNRQFSEKLREEMLANPSVAFESFPDIHNDYSGAIISTPAPGTSGRNTSSKQQQKIRMKRHKSRDSHARNSPTLKLRNTSYTRLPPINWTSDQCSIFPPTPDTFRPFNNNGNTSNDRPRNWLLTALPADILVYCCIKWFFV